MVVREPNVREGAEIRPKFANVNSKSGPKLQQLVRLSETPELPAHVSLLFPTCTVPLSQVASTAIAIFATFPRAATLLLIATFRDLPI
jgi:hypothetical protein